MEKIKMDIQLYLNEGFSLKEIEGIKRAKEEIRRGEILTEEQVKDFIENKLFAKYTMNA